jgi:hypothetical protein
MRREAVLILWGLFVLVAAVVISCVHEIPAPVEGTNGTVPAGGSSLGCSTDSVYFEQQVLPTITSLCGKSGCHGTTQHREFQLIFASKEQSYNAIRNRFSSNNALARALNEMAGEHVNGYSPPSSDQLAVIQKWISQGRQNNSCNGCDTTKFAYTANIAPLFKYYCAGCHPSPGSATIPNLSSYAAIRSELTNYPGRLLASIQWKEPYNTTIARMPQGSSQLSPCELEVIRKWIEDGAPDN